MLRYVSWKTNDPIALPLGRVVASGDAAPQVRDPARAAAIGDTDAVVAHIQATITQSLAEVLQGMEPSAEQLLGLRDEIASITLVSANRKLATHGVVLLDLAIAELVMTST